MNAPFADGFSPAMDIRCLHPRESKTDFAVVTRFMFAVDFTGVSTRCGGQGGENGLVAEFGAGARPVSSSSRIQAGTKKRSAHRVKVQYSIH